MFFISSHKYYMLLMFMLTAKDNHSAAKRKSRTTKKFWFIGNKLSKKFIMQELYERGAWKFCFIGLGPLGCLPISRALKPNATNNEGCFEELSALALAHNNALSGVLVSLEYILKGFKYVAPTSTTGSVIESITQQDTVLSLISLSHIMQFYSLSTYCRLSSCVYCTIRFQGWSQCLLRDRAISRNL